MATFCVSESKKIVVNKTDIEYMHSRGKLIYIKSRASEVPSMVSYESEAAAQKDLESLIVQLEK